MLELYSWEFDVEELKNILKHRSELINELQRDCTHYAAEGHSLRQQLFSALLDSEVYKKRYGDL